MIDLYSYRLFINNKFLILNIFEWIYSVNKFIIKLYNEKNKYVNEK
jgi:hypothetical protein